MDRNTSSNDAYRQLLDAARGSNSQSAGSENQQMAPQNAGSEVQQMIPQNATQAQRRGDNSQLYEQQLYQQQDQEQLQRRRQHPEQHEQRLHHEQSERQRLRDEQRYRQLKSFQEQLEQQPRYQEQRRRRQESRQEQLERQRLYQQQQQQQQQLQRPRQAQAQQEYPAQPVRNPHAQSAQSEIYQMAPPIATEGQRHTYNPQLFRYDPYPRPLQHQRDTQLQGQRRYQYEQPIDTVRYVRSQSTRTNHQRMASEHIAQAQRYGFDPSHLEEPQNQRRHHQYLYKQPTNADRSAYQQSDRSDVHQITQAHYRPSYEGLVQLPWQHGQPQFGSAHQQPAYGYAYALEQHPRYESHPHLQGFGEPQTQQQQPRLGFDHGGPALTRPQLPNQQPRLGFQPLEIDREPPADRNPGPPSVRQRRAPSASPIPAGSDFDRMSKDELRDWCRDRGLPVSHNRSDLIRQAKTGERIRVIRKGKNDRGKYKDHPIVIESVLDIRDFTYEDPEEGMTRDDVNEPGLHNYFYDSPPAEEEPETNQSLEKPEHEDQGGQDSLDDAGPSTSGD